MGKAREMNRFLLQVFLFSVPFLLSAAVFQVDEIDFHFTPPPVNNGTARIMVLFKGGKYPDPWVVHALAIFLRPLAKRACEVGR